MTRGRRAVATSVVVLVAACGGEVGAPRAQWSVALSTDAQLPQFGDRVFVEVLANTPCDLCRRQLGVPGAEDWPISFGIVPAAAAGPVRVRIRLFRTSTIGPDGVPLGSALVDALAVLPTPSGVTRVTVPLAMGCFSVPVDLTSSESCDPVTGTLSAAPIAPPLDSQPVLLPGSWRPGQSSGCSGSAPADMVCIPGGAFLLGDPRPHAIAEGDLTPTPERLVRVSPFYLDRDEFTLRALEAFFRAHPEITERPDGLNPANTASYQCKYPFASVEPNWPVNCVSHELATRVCDGLGKRLPTEAEWEYAAGQRGLETRFPWGDEEDVCLRAVVGRGEVSKNEVTACLATDTGTLPPGPQVRGSDTDLTVDGVRNLGGNLSEWVQDAFSAYDGECFLPDRVLLEDPRCDRVSSAVWTRVARGGNFRDRPIFARVTRRFAQPTSLGNSQIGFRCAMSAR